MSNWRVSWEVREDSVVARTADIPLPSGQGGIIMKEMASLMIHPIISSTNFFFSLSGPHIVLGGPAGLNFFCSLIDRSGRIKDPFVKLWSSVWQRAPKAASKLNINSVKQFF